jgi:hypothetical protein
VIKHTSFVFVVMSKKDSTIVGVYDDFRDAEDRLNEQPEQLEMRLAPHFPAPEMEP